MVSSKTFINDYVLPNIDIFITMIIAIILKKYYSVLILWKVKKHLTKIKKWNVLFADNL